MHPRDPDAAQEQLSDVLSIPAENRGRRYDPKEALQVELNDVLLTASEAGNAKAVRGLLDAGANVHVYDDQPLRYAAWQGHVEVVRVLLDSLGIFIFCL